jgi:fructokinase
VAACESFFFGTNTLVGPRERAITLRARERALDLGHPVLFDPNLRLGRWGSPDDALEAARACVPGALVVRCNRTEARMLTGEDDPEAGARALVAAGARTAVVTLGADGAIARGEAEAEAPGRPADVVSTVGAGDAFMGVLLGRLSLAAFDPLAVADALAEAVEESSRATERWGAVA